MPRLKLRFSVRLVGYSFEPEFPKGPLFHKWLPDGRSDAIHLAGPNEQEPLAIWFDRRARNDGGFLKWQHDGTEFDAATMQRQCKLDAGTLYGEMIATVSQTELTAIMKNPIAVGDKFGDYDPNDDDYVASGKRITGSIQKKLAPFIEVLRNQYGQYWLVQLHPWDSRQGTLGSYCNALGLMWCKDDQDLTPYWFLPTRSGMRIEMTPLPGRGYKEYLTEADWRALQQPIYDEGIQLGVQLLGQATASLDVPNWSQAFVSTISALEFALSRRLRIQEGYPEVSSALRSFEDHETLPARTAAVLLTLGIDAADIAAVLVAIATRNKVVHEAYLPTERDGQSLRKVMQVVGRVMGLKELKIPCLTSSNCLES